MTSVVQTSRRKVNIIGGNAHARKEISTPFGKYQVDGGSAERQLGYTVNYFDPTPSLGERMAAGDYSVACAGGTLSCPCGVTI